MTDEQISMLNAPLDGAVVAQRVQGGRSVPFLGSGTTTQVARKLGRRSIGIELNPAYEAVMRQRLGCDGGLFEDVSFE